MVQIVAADAKRYRRNLQGEVDSSALYRAMAAVEKNDSLAELYRRLAGVEEQHAKFWRARLAPGDVGVLVPAGERAS